MVFLIILYENGYCEVVDKWLKSPHFQCGYRGFESHLPYQILWNLNGWRRCVRKSIQIKMLLLTRTPILKATVSIAVICGVRIVKAFHL